MPFNTNILNIYINKKQGGLERTWTHTNVQTGEKEERLHRKTVCYFCFFCFFLI